MQLYHRYIPENEWKWLVKQDFFPKSHKKRKRWIGKYLSKYLVITKYFEKNDSLFSIVSLLLITFY